MTLLTETIDKFKEIRKTPKDIIFIGSLDGQYGCAWEQFEKLANINYDSGYGAPEIAQDLVIVFSDNTALTRGEYDGSEWWDYSPTPPKPVAYKPIKRLNITENQVGWESLSSIHRKLDDE